jgi:hypothetical protein
LIQLLDKVSAFKKKQLLRKRKINGGGEMSYVPRLQLFITENEIEFTANIVSVFERHLHDFSIHFEKYFPQDCGRFQWVKNPFSSDAPSEFSTTEEEERLELSSDSSPKVGIANILIFSKTSVPSFSNRALKVLIPFEHPISARVDFQQWLS